MIKRPDIHDHELVHTQTGRGYAVCVAHTFDGFKGRVLDIKFGGCHDQAGETPNFVWNEHCGEYMEMCRPKIMDACQPATNDNEPLSDLIA